MKKLLLTLIIGAVAFGAKAQDLAPDQNSNYKTSMAKYASSHGELQATMNTTVQSTYKAYDWSTARSERKEANRAYRREANPYNNYNSGFYNPYNNYNSGFYNPYNNGYYNSYNNGYNYYPEYYTLYYHHYYGHCRW